MKRGLRFFIILNILIGLSFATQAQILELSDESLILILDNNSLINENPQSESQDGKVLLSGGLEIFDQAESTGSNTLIKSGLQPTFEANVAQIAELKSIDGAEPLFDKLLMKIDPQNNNTTVDGAKFAVQISTDPTFSESSIKYVNPIGMQPDNVTNPDLSFYYRPCATSTGQAADLVRWECGNITDLKKYITGLTQGTNYCARVLVYSGNFSQPQAGPVKCETTQISTACFSIANANVSFGEITPGQIQTATPQTTVSASANTNGGYRVLISGTGNGEGEISGLYANDADYLIVSTSGDLNNIDEGYGMSASIGNTDTPSTLKIESKWDSSGKDAGYTGQIIRNPELLFTNTSRNPNTSNCTGGDSLNLMYKVKASNTAKPSAQYLDTITYSIITLP